MCTENKDFLRFIQLIILVCHNHVSYMHHWIGSCACFIIFTYLVLKLSATITDPGYQEFEISLYFFEAGTQCHLDDLSVEYPLKLNAPSLESFIRASTAMKDQELRLSGLAVSSKLANACQPLPDDPM